MNLAKTLLLVTLLTIGACDTKIIPEKMKKTIPEPI
jgi:hypothetical protein